MKKQGIVLFIFIFICRWCFGFEKKQLPAILAYGYICGYRDKNEFIFTKQENPFFDSSSIWSYWRTFNEYGECGYDSGVWATNEFDENHFTKFKYELNFETLENIIQNSLLDKTEFNKAVSEYEDEFRHRYTSEYRSTSKYRNYDGGVNMMINSIDYNLIVEFIFFCRNILFGDKRDSKFFTLLIINEDTEYTHNYYFFAFDVNTKKLLFVQFYKKLTGDR